MKFGQTSQCTLKFLLHGQHFSITMYIHNNNKINDFYLYLQLRLKYYLIHNSRFNGQSVWHLWNDWHFIDKLDKWYLSYVKRFIVGNQPASRKQSWKWRVGATCKVSKITILFICAITFGWKSELILNLCYSVIGWYLITLDESVI